MCRAPAARGLRGCRSPRRITTPPASSRPTGWTRPAMLASPVLAGLAMQATTQRMEAGSLTARAPTKAVSISAASTNALSWTMEVLSRVVDLHARCASPADTPPRGRRRRSRRARRRRRRWCRRRSREDVVGAGGDGDQWHLRPAGGDVAAGAIAAECDDGIGALLPHRRAAAATVSRCEPVSGLSTNSMAPPNPSAARSARWWVSVLISTRCAPCSMAPAATRRMMPILAASEVWPGRRDQPADVLARVRVDDDANRGHADQRPGRATMARILASMSAAEGRYACSSVGVNGTGENGAAMRPTGASR